MSLEAVKEAAAAAEPFKPEPPRPLVRETAAPDPFPIDALGDVLGGAVICDEEHLPVVRQLSRTCGPVLGPFESYMTMRGIKTFPLRMERQCRNACRLASWLASHPGVERVYYPADPKHPDAAVVGRLFPQDLYGAIAYSQKANRYGWAVDFGSQQEAENAALNECFNYGSDCKSIWFMNACGALDIGTDGGWGLNWGQNGRQAENKAVNQCTNVSSGCQPVFVKCVTGYN